MSGGLAARGMARGYARGRRRVREINAEYRLERILRFESVSCAAFSGALRYAKLETLKAALFALTGPARARRERIERAISERVGGQPQTSTGECDDT